MKAAVYGPQGKTMVRGLRERGQVRNVKYNAKAGREVTV